MLSVSLDRSSCRPGETFTVTVELRLGKPVKARGLYAKLVCSERKRVIEHRVMDKYDYDREKELGLFRETHMVQHTSEHSGIAFEQEKKISGEGEYSTGTFSVQFTLPGNAHPTSRDYGHDNKIHVWRVYAKLDIPLALDKSDGRELFVEGL